MVTKTMSNFISSTEIAQSRELKKKLQTEALVAVKADYEKREQIIQKKKENQKDGWMTSSLENRLCKDESKQKIKHKNKKKKSKRRHPSSSEDSDEEDEWVEKPSKGLEHEKWMKDDFLPDLKTFSSQEIKEQKVLSKVKQDSIPKTLSSFDSPGQHKKELNPFWKSGDGGLPTNSDGSSSGFIPDVAWLEKSLKRMQEQSKETGCDVESLASERYGSWQAFQDLLSKARKRSGRYQTNSSSPSRQRKFIRPSDGEHSGIKRYSSSSSNNTPKWKKKPVTVSQENIAGHSKGEKSKLLKSSISMKDVSTSKKSVTSNQLPTTISLPVSHNPSEPAQCHGKILTEQEKNVIGAKIIKAEIMGNQALIEKLKKKLSDSKEAEKFHEENASRENSASAMEVNPDKEKNDSSSSNSNTSDEDTVVLTRTTKTGQSWPVTESEYHLPPTGKRKKNQKTKMHDKEGNREKYFADDDQYSLKDLVKQERTGDFDSHTQTLTRLSSKLFTKTDGDNFTLDDMFESQTGNMLSTNTSDESRRKAIASHGKLMRRLEKCKFCFGNPENPKHLIISVGRASYLRLPSHCSLQDGHCLISPMHHCATGTNLDEDVWEEIRKFMQSLRNMFLKEDKDCIFLQTCMGLKKSPHFFIECVPMPLEIGELAPIYFKKAIQECEGEWAQNKKLIDTRGKNIKDKVPAGLPYFAVEFGLSGGFAHVIEDELKFPNYFGREILGGMLDADPYLWRKPKDERFNEQMKRSIEFEKSFKPHDWTITEIS